MSRASRVQIPENNLDNLSLTREEEDGTSSTIRVLTNGIRTYSLKPRSPYGSTKFTNLKAKIDSENWSIRRIGTQYGVSGLLGMGSKNKIFQNFLELVWIRRIGPPGYGVSDLLDTAYRTYWVRRIGLLRYGVLYILGTDYRASWVWSIG
ncbi:hypothetical protein Tco_0871719 [Tanacetum coccineum]